LRVAFLVSAFPVISETFILDQVTGLIDRGCEVTIFADEAVACPANHPEIDSYALSGMTHTAHLPKNHLWRPFLALRRAAANPGQLRTPHFRALNFLRHGWRAASLRLFLETQTCAPWPPFDILHCHFGPNGLRGLALRDIGALRGKLVTSFYGYDLSEFLKQHTGNPYAALLANSELSIAISEFMRRQLISLGCC
jgi:colanic acid/amylovoran biosynthesis glycosyltransferase